MKPFKLEEELVFDSGTTIFIDLSILSWSFRETDEGLKIVVRPKTEIEKQEFERASKKQ